MPLPEQFLNEITPSIGKPCLYIIKVEEIDIPKYKFGITTNIKQRLSSHYRTFAFTEITAISECFSITMMKHIEKELKTLTANDGSRIWFKGHGEIIQTNNIEKYRIWIGEMFANELNRIYKGRGTSEEEYRRRDELQLKEAEERLIKLHEHFKNDSSADHIRIQIDRCKNSIFMMKERMHIAQLV